MKVKTAALPEIVSPAAWEKAHRKLLAKEKAATRARDALAAERRRLPMVRIDKSYEFAGPDGPLRFLDLFEGRRQLIMYHFMLGPRVHGWPAAGCSMFVDQIGHLSHFHARDTSFTLVSLAPLAKTVRYRKRMGGTFPWVSSAGSDFNRDFDVTTDDGETFGLSVFLRDGDEIYRTSLHRRSRCRGAGERVDLPRSDTLWTPGNLGRFSAGPPANCALLVVATARRV